MGRMRSKTMKKYLEFLSFDSKIILFLIHACEGPVPEEVLGLLYAAANPSKEFSKSLHNVRTIFAGDLLRSGGLHAQWTRCCGMDLSAWGLTSLLSDCIHKNMAGKGDIRSLLETLVRDPERSGQHNRDSQTEAVESEKARVVTALCALFFPQTHEDEVVRDAATRAATACSLIDSNDRIDEFRRAIKPIIWFLYQSVTDDSRMPELNLSCVRQVLLIALKNSFALFSRPRLIVLHN